MRSRLRKRGEAATAEVVNVAGTRQLYDSTPDVHDTLRARER